MRDDRYILIKCYWDYLINVIEQRHFLKNKLQLLNVVYYVSAVWNVVHVSDASHTNVWYYSST